MNVVPRRSRPDSKLNGIVVLIEKALLATNVNRLLIGQLVGEESGFEAICRSLAERRPLADNEWLGRLSVDPSKNTRCRLDLQRTGCSLIDYLIQPRGRIHEP